MGNLKNKKPFFTYNMPSSMKLLAAGVIASFAAASVTHPCHAGYDCLEYKSTDALDAMVAEVNDTKNECLATAYDFREELIAEIRELRAELSQDSFDRSAASIAILTDAAADAIDRINALLGEIRDAIADEKVDTAKRVRSLAWDAIDGIKAIIGDEDEQAGYPYGGPQYGRGARSFYRRIYAQVENHDNPHFTSDDWAEGVHEVVATFEEGLQAESDAMAGFIADQQQRFDDAIADEKDAFSAAREAEMNHFNDEAAADSDEMNKFNDEQVARLDQIIADKLAAADAEIARLRDNFISEFLQTLWDIHTLARSYQRVLLVSKANAKKMDFFNAISDLRILLQRGLANEREWFIEQKLSEYNQLIAAQAAGRSDLASAGADLDQELWDDAGAAQDNLADFSGDVADWLDERLLQVGHEIEQYLSGYNGYSNHYPFAVRGYNPNLGRQIYGYAGHSYNTIDAIADKVAIFNDDHQGRFDDLTENEMNARQAAKDGITEVATNENTAAIDELCTITDALIEHIEQENESAMAPLTTSPMSALLSSKDSRTSRPTSSPNFRHLRKNSTITSEDTPSRSCGTELENSPRSTTMLSTPQELNSLPCRVTSPMNGTQRPMLLMPLTPLFSPRRRRTGKLPQTPLPLDGLLPSPRPKPNGQMSLPPLMPESPPGEKRRRPTSSDATTPSPTPSATSTISTSSTRLKLHLTLPEMRLLPNAKPDTTSSRTGPEKSNSASMTSLSEKKIDTPLLRSRRKNSATPLSKEKATFGKLSLTFPEPTSPISRMVKPPASTPTLTLGKLLSTRASRTSRTFQLHGLTEESEGI